MECQDITKSNLYIKRITNVIKNHNRNHHKLLTVKSRHCDAFVYILYGACTYNFGDDYEFTVQEGDIFYLANKSDYTMYIHTEDYHYIFCDFMFDDSLKRKSDLYTLESYSHAENLFNRLLNAYRSGIKGSFAEAVSILYSIYSLVCASANKDDSEEDLAEKRIGEAKEYIDTNYYDLNLSVSLLSEKAEVSEVYFRKLFKLQYNISPSAYIISKRLERAKELMKYPFMTLEECALQSGFSSVQYFCRVFKKSIGMTPTRYRNSK